MDYLWKNSVYSQEIFKWKRVYILSAYYSLSFHVQKKKEGFVINGKVKGFGNGKVILQRREDNNFITLDTAYAKNGEFILTGKIGDPQVCYIWLHDTLPPIRILLENVKYDLSADIHELDKPAIKGSPMQDKLNEYCIHVMPQVQYRQITMKGLHLVSKEVKDVIQDSGDYFT